jgi:hypothetical protein
MTDCEIQFPIKCPICRQEFLTSFRLSVVADAFATGDLRLYATCHVASWDATEGELELIRRYVDAEDVFSFPGLIEEIDYESVLREAGA